MPVRARARDLQRESLPPSAGLRSAARAQGRASDSGSRWIADASAADRAVGPPLGQARGATPCRMALPVSIARANSRTPRPMLLNIPLHLSSLPGSVPGDGPTGPRHRRRGRRPTGLSRSILGRPPGRAQGPGNTLRPGEMLHSGTSDNPMSAACPEPWDPAANGVARAQGTSAGRAPGPGRRSRDPAQPSGGGSSRREGCDGAEECHDWVRSNVSQPIAA